MFRPTLATGVTAWYPGALRPLNMELVALVTLEDETKVEHVSITGPTRVVTSRYSIQLPSERFALT